MKLEQLKSIVDKLDIEIPEFVIVGSLAFQLHKIDKEANVKDLDIAMQGSSIPTGWKELSSRFRKLTACKQIEGEWVECFVYPELPLYEEIEYKDVKVKVRTKKSLMLHYLSIKIDSLGDVSSKFKDKIQKRKNWSEQYLREFQTE